ncbi:hypothetical protein FS749_002113 [Ceratobasidium sp. UAMH 11750]|nr:hypothetical protein FS749_002113 [Ceratobasidium sp. UAMH 11750]
MSRRRSFRWLPRGPFYFLLVHSATHCLLLHIDREPSLTRIQRTFLWWNPLAACVAVIAASVPPLLDLDPAHPPVFNFSLPDFLVSRHVPDTVRLLSPLRIECAHLCPNHPARSAFTTAAIPAMPAKDPADQQAARTLKFSLREAVKQLERPPIELKWFTALPK